MNIKKVFNEVCLIEKNTNDFLKIKMFDSKEFFYITSKYLDLREHAIKKTNFEDNILMILEIDQKALYVHIKNGMIYISPYLNGNTEKSLDISIESYYDKFKIQKTKYAYEVLDENNNKYELNESIFLKGYSKIDSLERIRSNEPYIYLKIRYHHIVSLLEYTIARKEFAIKTSYVQMIDLEGRSGFNLISNNTFELSNLSNEVIKISELIKEKHLKIKSKTALQNFNPVIVKLNNRLFTISYNSPDSINIEQDLVEQPTFNVSHINSSNTRHGIKFRGHIDYKYHFNILFNNVVTSDGLILAKIQWEDNGDFEFEVSKYKLKELKEVHNNLYFAYNEIMIHPLIVDKPDDLKNTVLCTKNHKKTSYISRISAVDKAVITAIPKLPIYNQFNQFKIRLSKMIADSVLKFKKKNVNLYFEKDASSASESGFVTFEAIKKLEHLNSVNKFVIDNKSSSYEILRKKYKHDILKRFSFKHYYYVFMADHFISSELSNHVIATKTFDNLLSNKIKKTPLYFLQHGIMFAKPVENPQGRSFYKENQNNNLVKSVISSELEALEFYKMGYDKEDLMKTGLPKLDHAYLNKNANKIAFMPTWRYWEEMYVVNNEVEKTSYYQSIIEVIDAFEKAGLLDRLLIVPHNKFAHYFKENFKKYAHIIDTNPTEALKNSIIFITDYSSIIYDAIYRGAYPIFYWKEKDYLIKNYKATPPLNESNAPGPIAYNEEELIDVINKAIDGNYILNEEHNHKYEEINEFKDNQNTKRVIEKLIEDKVL